MYINHHALDRIPAELVISPSFAIYREYRPLLIDGVAYKLILMNHLES